jgi:hypothetical protein
MERGIVLARASSWQWVKARVPASIRAISIRLQENDIFNKEERKEVFAHFTSVILVLPLAQPDAFTHEQRIAGWSLCEQVILQWYCAWNQTSRFIVQFGEGVFRSPLAHEFAVFDYSLTINLFRESVTVRFPGIETMSYAQCLDLPLALDNRLDGQQRWIELVAHDLAAFDLLAVESLTVQGIMTGIHAYRRVGLEQPLWVTSFKVKAALQQKHGRDLRILTRVLPVQGILLAQLEEGVDEPDEKTLAEWGQPHDNADDQWTIDGHEGEHNEHLCSSVILQTWERNRLRLGAATSAEVDLSPKIRVQSFERGVLVLQFPSQTCTLLELPDS